MRGLIILRRKDREIADINDKIAIIEECKFCRLGLCENDSPYVVPLNYGYTYENERLTLFFHGALEGKKIDIIKKNNNACFEIDCDTKLIDGEKSCNYSYEFKSVIGFGKIIFLETNDEKSTGLRCLMKHQTGREIGHNFSEDELKNVCVFKMLVEEFTGKQKVLL
jgi:nitroimidazol reductase NimA-like FMN-containing flavoprotein (pyridoxamine 5'-phosphate oxidase superfamily)